MSISESIIRILDAATANKIAAGEVVERPASIIKELVENSLDAQASRIEVEISDGGTSYIRVTDNGIGMNETDARLAVVRHATSKIRCVEDLSVLQSLGFRGEALPSIAAVSRFSMTTRQPHNSFATKITVDGGGEIESEQIGGGLGTTIIVSDLFFNTPARKKFLKAVATEASHIHDILGKLALANPHVSFKLLNNQRLVLSTSGNDNLQDTVTSLYGHKVTQDLLPVLGEINGVTVQGYIGKPTLLKGSRQWQTFIVNGRVVQSRIFYKALDTAYYSLLPRNGYPLCVLQISVSSDTIDVNVHPQKSEIKFSDEQLIYRSLYRSVLQSLETPKEEKSVSVASEFSFGTQSSPQVIRQEPPYIHSLFSTPLPAESPSVDEQKMVKNNPLLSYHLEENQTSAPSYLRESIEKSDFFSSATLLSNEPSKSLENSVTPCSQDTIDILPQKANTDFTPKTSIPYPLGQVNHCYIIAQNEQGMFIIDQHAAHERILFDRLIQNSSHIPVQSLLVPIFLDLDPLETAIVTEKEAFVKELGFSFEWAGPSLLRIIELPMDIKIHQAEEYIRQLLGMIHTAGTNTTLQELRQSSFQMIACRNAIKAGDILHIRQMAALLEELWATNLPYTCPHGRPTIIHYSPNELDKMFKRI